MAAHPMHRVCIMRSIAFLVLLGGSLSSADKFSGWSTGRATYYGNNDGMSIHSGSCMFGSIDGGQGTGWDIAAISDKAPDYAGSCGRCYEVACRPASFSDGYGNSFERMDACNGEETIKVTITDTCPCYYPSNAYSNQRWCCGDQYHMDLSYWAFQKLASTSHGAIGIYYRQVPCDGSGSSSSSSSSSGNGQDENQDSSSSSDSDSEGDYLDDSSSSSGGTLASWLDMSRSTAHRDEEWPNRGRRKMLRLQAGTAETKA